MNLEQHYDQLYKASSTSILGGNYSLDTAINTVSDSRFGITLLIRPSEIVKANIQLFLNKLKTIEPNQYYYPDSDLHITVLSIISCYKGFSLDKINISDYVEIIQNSLNEMGEIKINFKGITTSPSAVMLQGFPTTTSLNNLRNKLRENFKHSDLEQSTLLLQHILQ